MSVMPDAKSMTLIQEGNMQKPIYYISRALRRVETQYPRIEMITFTVVTADCILPPYF